MENVTHLDSYRDPAREINREHQLAEKSHNDYLAHAIRCGELLNAQKAATPHGQWLPWVKENCEFEHATASTYMNLAKAQISNSAGNLSIREAVKATRSTKPAQATAKKVGWSVAVAGRFVGVPDVKNLGGKNSITAAVRARYGRPIPRFIDPEGSEADELFGIVRAILTQRSAEQEVLMGKAARETLSPSAQQRFDAVTARRRRDLESEYAKKEAELQESYYEAVRVEVLKRIPDEARREIERAQEQAADAQKLERIWRERARQCKAAIELMMGNWRSIVSCLHPDRAPPERHDAFSNATELALRIKKEFERVDIEKW